MRPLRRVMVKLEHSKYEGQDVDIGPIIQSDLLAALGSTKASAHQYAVKYEVSIVISSGSHISHSIEQTGALVISLFYTSCVF